MREKFEPDRETDSDNWEYAGGGETTAVAKDRRLKDRDPRYRVHLAVRFDVAQEFVSEYAENLSAGGLFVSATSAQVELFQKVVVEVALPGAGMFSVQAEVVHFLDAKTALATGRRPGIGLRVIEQSSEYTESLGSYLARLGRRADTAVLVYDDGHSKILAAAGYLAQAAPPPEELLAVLVKIEDPVLGIVVPSALHSKYLVAVEAAGGGVPLLRMDFEEQLDEILNQLDEEL